MICPAGRELTFRRIAQKNNGAYRVYMASQCRTCSFAAECVKEKHHPNRRLWVSQVAPQREQMRQKLKTPEGRARYRLRQQTVEPVIGHLKWHLRFPRFGLFGLRGAGAEFWLLCIAHNLLIYLRNGSKRAAVAVGRRARCAGKHILSLFYRIWRHCFLFCSFASRSFATVCRKSAYSIWRGLQNLLLCEVAKLLRYEARAAPAY